jgi:signal transduction histidine kinase
MTEYAKSRKNAANEVPVPGVSVPLESILCTEELRRRPSRAPDYEKENRALVVLGQALADSPHTVLQTLAGTILDICQAGSAGISLLTTHDGGKRFYWPAIAGRWKQHVGGGTPRDFGPCGDVLDRNTPLLMRHVERRYTYFHPVKPLVEEALLVPFYVDGKGVGTIWAVAHDARRKFDAEDERLMRSLGKFASSAYQAVISLDAQKSQLEERNSEVLQQSEQLQELSGRLLQTQDDERRRIARELHDSAGQIVTVLGLNLATIAQRVSQDAVLGKTLEESRELVNVLSKEIRTLSYLLHPPLLEENGLLGAVRWYAQGLMERSGLIVGLEISPDFGRLPDEMETAVFRIVQECMTNIHRHSGSKTATIRLSNDANNVSLEIQDEGKGISAERLAGIQAHRLGVGISGMRERVRHLRGVMTIESNSNGTKVSVKLPIITTSELGRTHQLSVAG